MGCVLFLFQLGGERCWLYEDGKGMNHGPHSISELISWHRQGYLQDSSVVISFSDVVYDYPFGALRFVLLLFLLLLVSFQEVCN